MTTPFLSPPAPGEPNPGEPNPGEPGVAGTARDIGEVPAVEVVGTAAIHLMSAAAVKLGLADDAQEREGGAGPDLAEVRILITALAGLITSAAPLLGSHHAAPLRDGLRTLQLAFREGSMVPDPYGQGPGESLTGPVYR